MRTDVALLKKGAKITTRLNSQTAFWETDDPEFLRITSLRQIGEMEVDRGDVARLYEDAGDVVWAVFTQWVWTAPGGGEKVFGGEQAKMPVHYILGGKRKRFSPQCGEEQSHWGHQHSPWCEIVWDIIPE